MRLFALIALSVALFLAAAKTHGRQMRLERELAGYFHVTFGARNAPWVEAHWRRDRFRFWPLAAALAALAALATLAWGFTAPAAGSRTATLVLAALLWAPAVSFATSAALSAARLARALGDPGNDGGGAWDPDARARWAHAAWAGSALWAVLTLALALAAVLLAFSGGRATAAGA
jgi:hypothetical protein